MWLMGCLVFGGDTKLDERDVLDETLYLLNTSNLLIQSLYSHF